VHVVDVNAERAEAAAQEIRDEAGLATAHAVDCSKAEAVEALAEAVYAKDGRVDVLCNNAGIGHAGAIEETTREDWERVLSINLWGVIHGITAFVPRMLRQGGEAHIVNTASVLGLIAAPGMAPYCASKFAVVGISECLAAELAPRGIGVTALCPGVIHTNIVKEASLRGDYAAKQSEVADFYATKGASPEEVARDALAAVRGRKVIAPSPPRQVLPPWLLKRLSLPAYQLVMRYAHKKIVGP
ncbi:MAG: SDR family NAD(P)-dependent oxidoreductase, partial [Candidatus Methylomirabilis sp.]|nr:SDR family NAD(P)-dependent oxidoreductase [Deltaproteobacteria bacterium]